MTGDLLVVDEPGSGDLPSPVVMGGVPAGAASVPVGGTGCRESVASRRRAIAAVPSGALR
ncbi:hypothetical protein [Streptomyces phaeoluteigriseus]